MRKTWIGCALACLALAAGCTDGPVAPAAAPTAAPAADLYDDECNESPTQILPEVCEDDPVVVFGWPFFGPPNDLLYEAAGDPSPGQPGLWLGAGVSPDACFGDRNPAVADADGDWLHDPCELELAKGFAPTMKFSRQDGCPDGEPYWAAKYFEGSGTVRIMYMPAYYDDCGPHGVPFGVVGGGHTGDSEFVMVEVVYDAPTRHWRFRRMFLSAHLGTEGNRSDWIEPSATQFTHRTLTHPTVWVAIEKHANYESKEQCNKTLIGDECEWSPLDPLRFPVLAHRNVGSRRKPLIYCRPSEKRFAGNGREECFYAIRSFNGWHTNVVNEPSTPYWELLTGWYYEKRCISWNFLICEAEDREPGTGTVPAYNVSLSGPSYAYNQTATVTAQLTARTGYPTTGRHYTWYRSICRNTGVSADCPSTQPLAASGVDVRSLSTYVSAEVTTVGIRVELRDYAGGPVLDTATFTVLGAGEYDRQCPGTMLSC
jgi:hypothetical protein